MSDVTRWTELQQEFERAHETGLTRASLTGWLLDELAQARAERDHARQLLDAALPVCQALLAQAVTFNETLAAERLVRQIKAHRR